MKRIFGILITLCIASQLFCSWAQRTQKLSNEDREKYLIEMRNSKHEFLTKELQLTREQQNAFFPIYDEMDDELNKINTETRELEQTINANPKATDKEVENAARTVFEQKQREGAVEAAYFNRFKNILKPKQLLKLKDAERKFTRKLVKQHKRIANQ